MLPKLKDLLSKTTSKIPFLKKKNQSEATQFIDKEALSREKSKNEEDEGLENQKGDSTKPGFKLEDIEKIESNSGQEDKSGFKEKIKTKILSLDKNSLRKKLVLGVCTLGIAYIALDEFNGGSNNKDEANSSKKGKKTQAENIQPSQTKNFDDVEQRVLKKMGLKEAPKVDEQVKEKLLKERAEELALTPQDVANANKELPSNEGHENNEIKGEDQKEQVADGEVDAFDLDSISKEFEKAQQKAPDGGKTSGEGSNSALDEESLTREIAGEEDDIFKDSKDLNGTQNELPNVGSIEEKGEVAKKTTSQMAETPMEKKESSQVPEADQNSPVGSESFPDLDSNQTSNPSQASAVTPEIDILGEMDDARTKRKNSGKATEKDNNSNSQVGDKVVNLEKVIDTIDPDGDNKKKEKNQFNTTPDYEKIGRGLVYNCVEKHWACLERDEYFKCKKGQIEAKQERITPLCMINDVYLTNEDCARAQLKKIREKREQDFCQK